MSHSLQPLIARDQLCSCHTGHTFNGSIQYQQTHPAEQRSTTGYPIVCFSATARPEKAPVSEWVYGNGREVAHTAIPLKL